MPFVTVPYATVAELDAAQERLDGMACEHPRMDECCPGCGHWYCPDCGVEYDEGDDFPQSEPAGPSAEDFE